MFKWIKGFIELPESAEIGFRPHSPSSYEAPKENGETPQRFPMHLEINTRVRGYQPEEDSESGDAEHLNLPTTDSGIADAKCQHCGK